MHLHPKKRAQATDQATTSTMENDWKTSDVQSGELTQTNYTKDQQQHDYFNPTNECVTQGSCIKQKKGVKVEENEKKRKKHRKADTIKRPMNAFMLWSKSHRSFFSMANPNMSVTNISVLLGSEWQKLSEDQKKPYYEQAHRIQQQHKHMYPEWVFQPKKKSRGPGQTPAASQTSSTSTVTHTPRSMPYPMPQTSIRVNDSLGQNILNTPGQMPVLGCAHLYPPSNPTSSFLSAPHWPAFPYLYMSAQQFYPSIAIPSSGSCCQMPFSENQRIETLNQQICAHCYNGN